MSEPTIETWTAGQMTEEQFRAGCVLHHAAFPKPGRTIEGVIAKKRPVWMGEAGAGVVPGPLVSATPPVRYVIRGEDGALVANAAILTRTISTEQGELTVSGLLDVATCPSVRGQGLGAKIVQAAWASVDDGTHPLCLFETGEARPFYEKLGARVVDNPIIDSTHPTGSRDNPFEDTWVMIYPARASWPEGEIDLRGPGY
ncbi:GNAT family N-acetyltransferase [Algisphaera agarilytica]|uniref:GNAT superfamily N-acetyltransferase n=1 Tax=Algisphaera agarilytica TaxID=1385975 RepID=A0A7X0H7S9_9BACT|nr:GNAT family N-acetyltransferase [Algisphaera agarilytica]MBB6429384.1 GNAT superfamily N-acetyltransferase [Algisphaera agarilytica]